MLLMLGNERVLFEKLVDAGVEMSKLSITVKG